MGWQADSGYGQCGEASVECEQASAGSDTVGRAGQAGNRLIMRTGGWVSKSEGHLVSTEYSAHLSSRVAQKINRILINTSQRTCTWSMLHTWKLP